MPVWIYVWVDEWMAARVCPFLHVCVWVCGYACMYVCVYAPVVAYAPVCMYVGLPDDATAPNACPVVRQVVIVELQGESEGGLYVCMYVCVLYVCKRVCVCMYVVSGVYA